MMRRFLTAVLLTASSSAYAQQPPIPQDKLIDILQRLEKRLDEVDHRLDAIDKKPTSAQPAKPASAQANPAGVAAKSAPAGKAVPGWKIDVLSYTKDGLSAPIARVLAPIGDIPFSLHTKTTNSTGIVKYVGSAFLKISEPGQYAIALETRPGPSVFTNPACQSDLSIDGNNIVSFLSKTNAQSGSGSVDLLAGTYLIKFEVGCFGLKSWNSSDASEIDRGDISINSENFKNRYSKTTVSIKILGPSDMEMREFKQNELFNVIK